MQPTLLWLSQALTESLGHLAQYARVNIGQRVERQVELLDVGVWVRTITRTKSFGADRRDAVLAQIDFDDGPRVHASVKRVVLDLLEYLVLCGQVEALQVGQRENEASWYLLDVVLGQVDLCEFCAFGERVFADRRDLVGLEAQVLQVGQIRERGGSELLDAVVVDVEVNEAGG